MNKWLLVFVAISMVIYLGVKDVLNPYFREDIQHTVYTIGDSAYQRSLSEGKRVVKFGPAFWGLYPGGLAFPTSEKAEAYYLQNREQFAAVGSRWIVAELSGDLELDTYAEEHQRYLNKSLFVTRIVKPL